MCHHKSCRFHNLSLFVDGQCRGSTGECHRVEPVKILRGWSPKIALQPKQEVNLCCVKPKGVQVGVTAVQPA